MLCIEFAAEFALRRIAFFAYRPVPACQHLGCIAHLLVLQVSSRAHMVRISQHMLPLHAICFTQYAWCMQQPDYVEC